MEELTPKPVIGVDLGTTNTCAAIVKDKVVSFLELEPGSLSMPSAIRFVDRKTDEIILGRLAKRFAISKPKEVFVSFKSLMQNEEWLNDPKIVEHYKIGEQQFTPTDMAARILTHVFNVAQKTSFASNGIINNIKICVPAASTPYYKKEVVKAAVQAGFGEKDDSGAVILDENNQPKGISIVEEPFAAAYSYGFKNGFFDPEKSKDQNIMVYDFGGGTFDVSIINVISEKDKEPTFKMLGTYGVTHLGGDDIDFEIMKIAAKQFYKETKIDLINVNKDNKGIAKRDILMAHSTLKELAERSKIEDFSVGAAESELQQLGIIYDPEEERDCNLDVIVKRDQFLEAIKPLLVKTIECAKNALQESGLTLEDINRFVLVGGSTKAPWVQEAVKSFIERELYLADNVDVIVGEGAAYMAAATCISEIYPPKKDNTNDVTNEDNNEEKQTDDKPTIKNKTSQYYGVEVRGGFFIPLIAKGLEFDDDHPSYSGSIKCTNPNDSGHVYITGWSTQEDVIDRDEQGEPITDENGMMSSSKSVHFIQPDNSRLFQSFGQLSIEVPKAEPHTLDIKLTLTILRDNSLTISVKVGDNEPIIQPW